MKLTRRHEGAKGLKPGSGNTNSAARKLEDRLLKMIRAEQFKKGTGHDVARRLGCSYWQATYVVNKLMARELLVRLTAAQRYRVYGIPSLLDETVAVKIKPQFHHSPTFDAYMKYREGLNIKVPDLESHATGRCDL